MSYFCHTCSSFVDAAPNDAQELECGQCGDTFVEIPSPRDQREETVRDGGEDTPSAGSGAATGSNSTGQQQGPPPDLQQLVNQLLGGARGGNQIFSFMQAMTGAPGGAEVFVGDVPGGETGGMPAGLAGLDALLTSAARPGGAAPGNVGDYAFGDLTRLIEQLMQNDAGRHGPPPAAQHVVDGLPSIKITQGCAAEDVECTICKDVFTAGDEARELPCQHLFHNTCILPWLTERNSCPTCRHELPTDDAEYNRLHATDNLGPNSSA